MYKFQNCVDFRKWWIGQWEYRSRKYSELELWTHLSHFDSFNLGYWSGDDWSLQLTGGIQNKLLQSIRIQIEDKATGYKIPKIRNNDNKNFWWL